MCHEKLMAYEHRIPRESSKPAIYTCGNIWSQQFALFPRYIVQERIGNCSFISCFPQWSAPKQRKNSKTAKKPIERMETATYQEFGRSPPEQRNAFKIAQKTSNAPSVMQWHAQIPQETLGNGRKKLGLVPLARWNHKNETFLQCGNDNLFSSFPGWSAPKQRKN